uniref:Protein TIC 214 n=1 Tax=Pinus latteri TaxID=1044907 RepID=A0A451FLE2_9CONI|nr:vacuolar glutathione S-conjugate [Pinus latteri]
MIKVLGLLLGPLSSWVEVSGPIIIFGLYYGFLATLPFGPSKIYSTRSFLLGKPGYGIIAISGSITGQLIGFLSMYYSPIYAALWKPYAITLLVVPYMFFRFFQIMHKPSSSESLHLMNSINNPKALSLFMDGLILQLLNPILLANPVLTRLVNLFLFRYSPNISFMISGLCGWLGGHILLTFFIKWVSFRIDRNSLIDNTLLRRYINRTFSLLILCYCSFYLGRAPLPFLKGKNYEDNNSRSVTMARDDRSVAMARKKRSVAIDPQKLQELVKEEKFFRQQPWPIMCFDHNRVYQPIRYIGNSPFTRLGPVRTEVSQYFFGAYSSDGKKRISFTCLPSVLVLGEKLGEYRDFLYTSCSSEDPYYRWNHTMKRKRDSLGNEFSDRVKALSHGSPAENVIERRVKFSNSKGDSFTEMYDPFLNGAFRGTINQFESPQMLNDSIISNFSDFIEISMKDRKGGFPNDPLGYGYHISYLWQELEHESFPLPWEPLPTDTIRSLVPVTISSNPGTPHPKYALNRFKLQMFSDLIQIPEINPPYWLALALRSSNINIPRQIALCNGPVYTNYLVYAYTRFDHLIKPSPAGIIKMELILCMFKKKYLFVYENLCFLFECLAQYEWTILLNSRGLIPPDTRDSMEKKDFIALYREILLNEPLQIREIRKHVPRWSSGLMIAEYDDVDPVLLSSNRILSRKVKDTMTFDIGQRRIGVVQNRYSAEADYRRNLIQGSIRAKRRKIMIWKRIQPNVHSLFFLKRKEIPAYPKDYYDTSDSGRVDKEQIEEEVREKIQRVEDPLSQQTIAESLCLTWPELHYFRGLLLMAQSNIRKNIILPSLIIAKNMGRILLFQVPEFYKDWEEMRREMHVICASDGTELSETTFPDKWETQGMQIKLLFPFRLKPWHRSKPQSAKRLRSSYLTTFGLETDIPFGDPNSKLGIFSKFLKPIFKKVKRRLMGSTGIRRVPRVGYIDKSELNDRIQNKLLSETTPMGSANDSSEVNDQFGYETQTINVKDQDDWTTTMKERIESIAIINSSPITGMSLVDSEIHTGSKGSFNILGLTLKKRLVQIRRIPGLFRNKSVQLIRKRFYSMKFFIKRMDRRMDRDLLPSVINFIASNIKFWIQSAWIRSTRNITTIYGRIFIINKDISRINRGKITNYYSINEKIQDFEIRPDRNMFSMSQAYIYHKIWQIRALDIQRILDHEKPQDLKENDWKQWLRCFDRYNLSPQIWSRINPNKCRNIVNKQCTCYEERFVPYEQQEDSIFATVMEPFLGLLRKMNKRYRYDLLSYSYLNYTKDSDIINLTDIPGPPVQPAIPDERDITYREGILKEKFINDIIEEDWKGTDFNIVNGSRSTVDIYDAIRSCDYDHTTSIDRQKKKTDLITNQQGIDETRRENVGIMDSPKIEKRISQLDLNFWLFPELSGIKNIYYETKSKFIPGNSLLREERERKKIEEEERKETTNVLEQIIGIRSNVKNKQVEHQDKKGQVEHQDKKGQVEDQQTDGKKKTNKGLFQCKVVDVLGKKRFFYLANICRVMSGMKDPGTYLRIQEGNIDLSLMAFCIAIQKNSNANKISKELALQRNVRGKVRNDNEIREDKKIMVFQPYRLSSIVDDQFLMYKIVSISLKLKKRAGEWIDGDFYDGSVQRGKILGDEKKIFSSLNLEDILLPKRRREFRILNRFDLENDHVGFSNGKDIQNDEELMGRDQHLSVDTTQIIKRFLWPSYRLEDIICMNRYWFNTNDGSRSAMLRIRMYPLTVN